MKKRSITIAGHHTSITLEEPFWLELKQCARRRDVALHELVTEIDATRDLATTNLSSALRLYVLDDLRQRLASATGETAHSSI